MASTVGTATRETLNDKMAINQKHFLPGGESITRPTETLSSTKQRGKSCIKQWALKPDTPKKLSSDSQVGVALHYASFSSGYRANASALPCMPIHSHVQFGSNLHCFEFIL